MGYHLMARTSPTTSLKMHLVTPRSSQAVRHQLDRASYSEYRKPVSEFHHLVEGRPFYYRRTIVNDINNFG